MWLPYLILLCAFNPWILKFTSASQNPNNFKTEESVEHITDLASKKTDTMENKKLINPELKTESSEELELQKKCQQFNKLFMKAAEPLVPYAYTKPDMFRLKTKIPVPPVVNLPKSSPISGEYLIFTQNPEMYGDRPNTYKMETAASSMEEEVISPPSEELDHMEEYDITSTSTVSTTARPRVDAISTFKYVRLDSIILKNIVLPSGRTTQYWYHLLRPTQSFVQIPDTAENQDVVAVAQPQNYDARIALPAQYQLYVDPHSGVIKATTPVRSGPVSTTGQSITTAIEQPQLQFFVHPVTGLIYQSGLPHHFIYHTSEKPMPPTTTEKVPELTYTVDFSAAEEKPAENNRQFKHEFRFVTPMLLPSDRAGYLSNYPYQFDPYAYLPRRQRPEMMNIPVPYVPSYQMIHRLAMPSMFQKQSMIEEDDA